MADFLTFLVWLVVLLPLALLLFRFILSGLERDQWRRGRVGTSWIDGSPKIVAWTLFILTLLAALYIDDLLHALLY